MSGPRKCDYCAEPSITELDGDNLCQRHADQWCRVEEEDRRERIAENGQFGVGA